MAMTVLVVEDTELLRRMYSDRLTSDGYRVLSAADGLEALSLLRSETPDLVLLDLVMPKMSGLEVIELMNKDPRTEGIPVLILSNLGQDEDIRRGIELGAVDYLIKNDSRLTDVSAKIAAILKVSSHAEKTGHYNMLIRDHEGDCDRLVADAGLTRRFWCPTCEHELHLEMIAKTERKGWYDAHLLCPICGREY